MATLKDKHKAFIITRLACFDSPTEAAQALKEEFGIEVDRAQVSYYNPNSKHGGANLAQKWKDLFDETREKFKNEIQDIPIANQAYRLRELQRNLDRLKRMQNYRVANETIEQAAKEVGGAYTNIHDLKSSDGSMAPTVIQRVIIDPKHADEDGDSTSD